MYLVTIIGTLLPDIISQRFAGQRKTRNKNCLSQNDVDLGWGFSMLKEGGLIDYWIASGCECLHYLVVAHCCVRYGTVIYDVIMWGLVFFFKYIRYWGNNFNYFAPNFIKMQRFLIMHSVHDCFSEMHSRKLDTINCETHSMVGRSRKSIEAMHPPSHVNTNKSKNFEELYLRSLQCKQWIYYASNAIVASSLRSIFY